jgi:hypothetical protein
MLLEGFLLPLRSSIPFGGFAQFVSLLGGGSERHLAGFFWAIRARSLETFFDASSAIMDPSRHRTPPSGG